MGSSSTMQTSLLIKTRWRLVSWYAGIMSLMLSLCGLAVYQGMIRAYLLSIDRELESVTGTLHKVIEPNLQKPGQIEPIFRVILPNICVTNTNCSTAKISSHIQLIHGEHGIFSPLYQNQPYYIRFIDPSQRLIAVAGVQPEELPNTVKTEGWQTLKDSKGILYSQKSLILHTQDNQVWGYIQVGRSLKELNERRIAFKLILAIGLPIIVLLVSGSSWWLAGLAIQPIHKSYQQMQKFTADVSHELRTPLAAINAKVETALDNNHLSEQKVQDVLTSVKRQNHRLIELIQDLLLLSRLEQNTLTTQKQACCINVLIDDLVEEFSALAHSASLSLKYVILSDSLLYVMGDEEQLLRLFSNLIANGIKYTPSGGEISLIVKTNKSDIIIEVKDTGIGILPQEQQAIFDRFYRIHSDRSRDTGGAGLGLAIVGAIVKAHGGKIQVNSQLGLGSTFSVYFPPMKCSTLDTHKFITG